MNKLFRVECAIFTRDGHGWAATRIRLNEPPKGGSCSIVPKKLEVTKEKLFLIHCWGWEADTGIASYRFYSYFDVQRTRVQITSVRGSGVGGQTDEVKVNVTLYQGAHWLCYNNTVFVSITDTLGAFADFEVGTVQVFPIGVQKIVKETEVIQRRLSTLYGEGVLVKIVEAVTGMSGMLNSYRDQTTDESTYSTFSVGLGPYYSYGANTKDCGIKKYHAEKGTEEQGTNQEKEETATISDGNASASDTYERERDSRAQARASILSPIVQLPRDTMLGRTQMLSAICELALHADEITGESQMLIAEALESFAGRLDDGEEVTPEQWEQNWSYLLEAMAALLDAAGTSGLKGTLTDLVKASERELFLDYSTDITAENDVCVELLNKEKQDVQIIDEAVNLRIKVANCEHQRGVARQLAERMSKMVRNLWKSYARNSVVGESKQFNSGHARSLLLTVPATVAFQTPQKLEFSDAEVTLPSSIKDVVPNVSVDQIIVLQLTEYTNSPHRYSLGSKHVPTSTRFVSLYILTDKGERVLPLAKTLKPVHVKIPRDQQGETPQRVEYHLSSWNQFQIHKSRIEAPGSSLHVKMCPEDRETRYALVISLGTVPETGQGHCHKAALVPTSPPDAADQSTCTYVFMDNEEVNNYQGDVFVGVRQLNDTASTDLHLQNATGLECGHLPAWPNGSDSEDEVQMPSRWYSFQVFTSACYSISEGEEDWTTEGCRVQEDTNDLWTACECTRLADTFAGGWMVRPNTIDWNLVFSNMGFLTNPTLYSTQIVVCVAFVLAVIWARRKDRRDVEKLGIAPLVDNDPRDRYYYEIFVQTSIRANAGTDSNVFFILSGEEGETDVRQFSDSRREIFQRGSTDGFLVATERCLGDLIYVRVWHDCSGQGDDASWYLNYLVVRDLQTRQKWYFPADTWLAVEEGDGQVHRLLPTTSAKSISAFGSMLEERSRHNLADQHLWFSVLARPPASPFTRVQRLSCCLCLLYVTMLANALFYGTKEEGGTSVHSISVGPVSISLEEIYTGVISNLIVFPVNFLIVVLFRKSARRPQVEPRDVEAARDATSLTDTSSASGKEESTRAVDAEAISIISGSLSPGQEPGVRGSSPPSQPRQSLSRQSRPDSSLSGGVEDEPASLKKKECVLPWWCRIVAWIILILTTFTSVIFVNFYGITFQDDKCRKWIISMLFSFLMSIFITQPVKVCLVLLFLSLIFKKRGVDDDIEYNDDEKTQMAKDETPLHSEDWNGAAGGGRPDSCRPRSSPSCYPQPLNRRQLQRIRQKRLRELEMWTIIREVLLYTVFVTLLMVISYRQRSYDTFLYKHTMERVFIRNNETRIDFHKIRNARDYWTWARSGLITGLRAGSYYNDYPPFMLRGYVNDKESKILGYATMRQLRIRPSLCEIDRRVLAVMMQCNTDYDVDRQEEGAFDVGWTTLKKAANDSAASNDTSNGTTPMWYSYTKAEALDGHPYWGQLAVYSGGGYVVPLRGPKADLLTLLTQLQQQNWIDRYTRAVFVEFTIYNAQVNLFGIATILAEFHPTGGVVQSYHFEPAMLLPYKNATMVFQLVCEIFFCCFFLAFAVKLLMAFIRQKLAFFKEFWNLTDLGIVALSVADIVIYFYRLLETKRLMRRFKASQQGKEEDQYIKFQYVAYWNEVFTILMAWVVFLVSVKFLRLLRFNRRVAYLAETLRRGSRTLLHFSVIFWLVFLAFAALFFLSFMTVDKYSTFVGSIVACVLMLMGKFDIYTLTMAQPVLAQVMVFLFVLTLSFMVLNMFVSILTDTFTDVRRDASERGNRYEILSYLFARLRRFAGIHQKSAAPRPSSAVVSPVDDRADGEGRSFTDDEESDGGQIVDEFNERVDRLLASLSRVCAEDEPDAGHRLTLLPPLPDSSDDSQDFDDVFVGDTAV